MNALLIEDQDIKNSDEIQNKSGLQSERFFLMGVILGWLNEIL